MELSVLRRVWRLKKGKIITTISLDNEPELMAHCQKQKNFSRYVQNLILQDMARLERAEKELEKVEHVELTEEERGVYSFCLRYIREYGTMKYGDNYEYFPLQPEEDVLRLLLGDVRDRLKEGKTYEHVKKLTADDSLWNVFYDRINRYWRQQNPIPTEWKKQVVPGLTMHEALARIIPEALRLKSRDKATITVKRISELIGLTYQQAYTNLLPHVQPVLRKMGIEV